MIGATQLWLEAEHLITALDAQPRPHTRQVAQMAEQARQRARRRYPRTVRRCSADIWFWGKRGWEPGHWNPAYYAKQERRAA